MAAITPTIKHISIQPKQSYKEYFIKKTTQLACKGIRLIKNESSNPLKDTLLVKSCQTLVGIAAGTFIGAIMGNEITGFQANTTINILAPDTPNTIIADHAKNMIIQTIQQDFGIPIGITLGAFAGGIASVQYQKGIKFKKLLTESVLRTATGIIAGTELGILLRLTHGTTGILSGLGQKISDTLGGTETTGLISSLLVGYAIIKPSGLKISNIIGIGLLQLAAAAALTQVLREYS